MGPTTSRRILLVDDEKVFLRGLADHLRLRNPDFELLTAGTGVEALRSLEKGMPDLVITDVHMPELDGLELLAAVSHADPKLPVIVMTAYGTPRLESRAVVGGAFALIDKPIDMDELSQLIGQALSKREEGELTGISLAGFLQLLQMERKTCRVRVQSRAGEGILGFDQGQLVDARFADLGGDEAALVMMNWPGPRLSLEATPDSAKVTVKTSLVHLLMAAAQNEDETRMPSSKAVALSSNGAVKGAPRPSAGPAPDPVKPSGAGGHDYPDFEALEKLPGFLAFALLHRGGKSLRAVGEIEGIALSDVASAALGFVAAKEQLAQKLGSGEGLEQIAVTTRDHCHFYRPVGAERVLYAVVLRKTANQALVQRKLSALGSAIESSMAEEGSSG